MLYVRHALMHPLQNTNTGFVPLLSTSNFMTFYAVLHNPSRSFHGLKFSCQVAKFLKAVLI